MIINYACGDKVFQVFIPDHHKSHEWRNGVPPADAVTFHPRMFAMMRGVVVTGSVLIKISPFYYIKDNAFHVVGETTLNTTPYLATQANKVRLAVVGFNMDTEEMEVYTGEEVVFSAITPPPLPTGFPDNFFPSFLVRLKYNATELFETDMTDARFALQMTGSSSEESGGWPFNSIVIVSPTNPHADFTTIQAAIDSIAANGSISILVDAGTHTENLTIDSKRVHIGSISGDPRSGTSTISTIINGTITVNVTTHAAELLLNDVNVGAITLSTAAHPRSITANLRRVYSSSTSTRLTTSGNVICDIDSCFLSYSGGNVIVNGGASASFAVRIRNSRIVGAISTSSGAQTTIDASSLSEATVAGTGALNISDREQDTGLCEGRLTLASGLAAPAADQLAKTTIFFTPYRGNRLSLYDGIRWKVYNFTERSASLSGLTANTNYDVFIYDSAGTLTLDLVAWTNDSTRATNLTLQNGVYVKDGATARRYLGTFRITGTTGQSEDSKAKRFVWNYYNRVQRSLAIQDATDSWNYTLVAWRQANNSSANQVAVVIGISEEEMSLTAIGNASKSDGGNRYTGIGHNSTTSNIAQVVGGAGTTNLLAGMAIYTVAPTVGYHFFAWLESVQAATGTCTWYGDAGITNQVQSGMVGRILA